MEGIWWFRTILERGDEAHRKNNAGRLISGFIWARTSRKRSYQLFNPAGENIQHLTHHFAIVATGLRWYVKWVIGMLEEVQASASPERSRQPFHERQFREFVPGALQEKHGDFDFVEVFGPSTEGFPTGEEETW
jgi:hypothetical protein